MELGRIKELSEQGERELLDMNNSVDTSQESKERFESEDDIEHFEIIEKSKDRIIGGVVSTDSVDLDGDRITPNALKSLWKQIQSMPNKYLNLMIGHSSTQCGYIIPSYGDNKSHLKDNKLYLIAKLRDDSELADEVWEKILSNELHSFSIKFLIPDPLKTNIKKVCDADRCWKEIIDAKFIELSLTSSASNQDTYIETLSKSI